MISLFQHKFRFLEFQMYTILLKYAELFLYHLNNPDFGKRITIRSFFLFEHNTMNGSWLKLYKFLKVYNDFFIMIQVSYLMFSKLSYSMNKSAV
jgi:hypothetical protein